MKMCKFYDKYYKMKKLTKIEIIYFFNQNISHCHYPCFVFKMDTLFGNYNSEEDTKAIENTDRYEFAHVKKVYQHITSATQDTMPYFPPQPQQPTVFVPCKYFKNVVRQNTGSSYDGFWEVIENVITVLKLSPDVETQYRGFADSEYRKKNPNA